MRLKFILILFISLNLIFCASPQKKIQEEREKDPRHQYNIGLVHLNRGNVDEAMRYFRKSLSLNPDYYLALNAMGLAYFMKGSLQDSVKYLERCLAINPTFAEAHNNLGMSYQEMGLLDNAHKEFRIAANDKTNESRELAYYNLARLYMIRENYQEALDHVIEALKLNKRMGMAHNLKGVILEKLDDLEEAIVSYKQAVKLEPLNTSFSFNLGVAYFKNNDFDQAEEIFERIYDEITDLEMKSQVDKYLEIIKKS